jgi:hypothetical protein
MKTPTDPLSGEGCLTDLETGISLSHGQENHLLCLRTLVPCDLITSQRSHLQIPSHWGLSFNMILDGYKHPVHGSVQPRLPVKKVVSVILLLLAVRKNQLHFRIWNGSREIPRAPSSFQLPHVSFLTFLSLGQ